MKTILLWDPRFPDRTPTHLLVDDAVAAAAVRAGVAAAADPLESAGLIGSPLDPGGLTEMLLKVGYGEQLARVIVPATVLAIAQTLGLGVQIGGVAVGTPTPTPTPPIDGSLPVVTLFYDPDVANPNSTYPPPIRARFSDAVQVGVDTLQVRVGNGYDFVILTFADLLHPLVPADGIASLITIGLSVILSGIHSFQARINRGGAVGNWGNQLVHGDAVGPVASTMTLTPSIPEDQALAILVTLDKPGTITVDNALCEVVQNSATTSTIRLLDNKLLDFEDLPAYAINVTPTGLNGVAGAALTINVTVLNLDEIPDDFGFADENGATVGQWSYSNSVTLANFDPTISLPGALTGGVTPQLQITRAGSVVQAYTANPGPFQVGDVIRMRDKPTQAGQTTAALTIGGVTGTFQMTTTGYIAPATTTLDPAHTSQYAALSSGNRQVTPTGGNHAGSRSTTSRNTGVLFAEIIATALGNTGCAWGVCNATYDPAAMPDALPPTGSAVYATSVGDHIIDAAGGDHSVSDFFSDGGRSGLELDFNLRKVTFYVGAAAQVTLDMPTGALFLFATPYGSSCGFKINAGQDAFGNQRAGTTMWG